jgi:chorismate-pyruvate lyase
MPDSRQRGGASPTGSERVPAGLSAVSRARHLLESFHNDVDGFVSLGEVGDRVVPAPYRELLDHCSHMTVAMERFSGGPVSLRVVAERPDADQRGGLYAREILLEDTDGRVVQYGVVRIDLTPLPEASRRAILSKSEPLGKILIASGLHREVQAVELLEVVPGEEFGRLMQAVGPTFGRVAEIRLGGRPAVELLEVVPALEG